jgi:predicted amidohydrolase YtcJ
MPSRLIAEEIVPDVVPALDPNDREEFNGPADVILHGGPILTMTPSVAEAVAVRAGRIQEVGELETVLLRRGRLTRIVNLDGRALSPGFVNAHWHPPLDLLCDCVEVMSAGAITTAVAASAERDAEEWLVVIIAGVPNPKVVADELDLALPRRPEVAIDVKGIIVAANRLGSGPLRDLADGNDAPDFRGLHVSALAPTFLDGSRETLQKRLADLLDRTAGGGVTTLRVCGLGAILGAEDLDLLREAAGQAGRLRVRGALSLDRCSEWRERRIKPGSGNDMLRFDAMTAWFDEGFSRDSQLIDDIDSAARDGWRTTLHVDRPEDIEACLGHLEASPRAASIFRDGIEFRTMPSSTQLGRLKALGLSVGVTFEPLAREDAPASALASADAIDDVTLSLGVDAAAGPTRPSAILDRAVTSKSMPISASAALRGVTLDAARRCGVGNLLGSLEVGKYADFAFLESDTRRYGVHEMGQLRCIETWVAGREVRA